MSGKLTMGPKEHTMVNGTSNGTASRTQSSSIEIVEKPKRRRFSVETKLRILHAADACAPRTVGAYVRREGIYSPQLYAWRRERERGDLNAGALRKRTKAREAERELTIGTRRVSGSELLRRLSL